MPHIIEIFSSCYPTLCKPQEYAIFLSWKHKCRDKSSCYQSLEVHMHHNTNPKTLIQCNAAEETPFLCIPLKSRHRLVRDLLVYKHSSCACHPFRLLATFPFLPPAGKWHHEIRDNPMLKKTVAVHHCNKLHLKSCSLYPHHASIIHAGVELKAVSTACCMTQQTEQRNLKV